MPCYKIEIDLTFTLIKKEASSQLTQTNQMKILAKVSKLILASALLFVAYVLYTGKGIWGISPQHLYIGSTFIAAMGFLLMAKNKK